MAEILAELAAWLPFGYAFGAGLVASVNPCGFLLLPAYVSYYLGTEEVGFQDIPWWRRGARGIGLGATVTLGFLLLFGAVGLTFSLGGKGLARLFPPAGLAIGIGLIGLGLWLLGRGGSLGLAAARRVRPPQGRGLPQVFLFGVVYGVASLACTLPIFLVVVGSALAGGGFLRGLGQFLSYGLGMGAIVVAVLLGAALLKGAVIVYLRRALPYVHRSSALFLVGAGAYLVYFWLRSGIFP